jgi:hypothetical protein
VSFAKHICVKARAVAEDELYASEARETPGARFILGAGIESYEENREHVLGQISRSIARGTRPVR